MYIIMYIVTIICQLFLLGFHFLNTLGPIFKKVPSMLVIIIIIKFNLVNSYPLGQVRRLVTL